MNNIGGFRGGVDGNAAPLFFFYFQNIFYDPNPSNRFLSVVMIMQSG